MKASGLYLLLVAALILGCRKQSNASWIGGARFKFHGAEIELPNNGIGEMSVGPNGLDFQWDGKELAIRGLGGDTFSVTTPAENDRGLDKNLVIVIDSEGNISTHSSKVGGENQKPQQDAP
jgi:hypothetical protein